MNWWRRNRTLSEPVVNGPRLGDLSGPVARISPSGTVVADDGAWTLEWGVRAGEGWLQASEQRAVRQGRVEDTPVYETWMRVPGGDVIQRVGISNDGRGRALVIRYENASPDAVVVATVGHTAGRIDANRSELSCDGNVWIRSEREAGSVAVGADVWSQVVADPNQSTASGRDHAALLVPLPHRQHLTVVVRIDGTLPVDPPTPEALAAGWRQVTDRALTVEVPDPDLDAAWRRVRGDLVLAAGSTDPVEAGEAAWWLDLAGLIDEGDRARRMVLAAADRSRLTADGAVVALRALASGELRGGQVSELAEVAGPLVRLAGSALDRTTVAVVAQALARRSPDAAADAERLLAGMVPGDRALVSPVALGAARVLGHLFGDVDHREHHRIEILPNVPDNWRGQAVDARGIVTGYGMLSFSVRWHGERPALLWQRDGGPDELELGCPGLDPAWTSRQRSGEALLDAP